MTEYKEEESEGKKRGGDMNNQHYETIGRFIPLILLSDQCLNHPLRSNIFLISQVIGKIKSWSHSIYIWLDML